MDAILIIIECQCADQLPGGKYWNPSPSMIAAASSVPMTNKASEADFGILDLLVRIKPNANISTMLTLIMWSKNKTEWIRERNSDDRAMLLEKACKAQPKMKNKYEERKTILQSEKQEKLLLKQRTKVDEEAKAAVKKVHAVNQLIEYNTRAWISEEEAEKEIMCIDEEKRNKILLVQINFHKVITKIECNAKFYLKTKVVNGKRVNLTWIELLGNLKSIILATRIPEDSVCRSVLKAKEVRYAVLESEKTKLMSKIKQTRLEKIKKQQRLDILPTYLEDPALLVGNIIQHRV